MDNSIRIVIARKHRELKAVQAERLETMEKMQGIQDDLPRDLWLELKNVWRNYYARKFEVFDIAVAALEQAAEMSEAQPAPQEAQG